MAKPNYSFEKRQRDLEKKRKQEEKRLRKITEKKSTGDENSESPTDANGLTEASPEDKGL